MPTCVRYRAAVFLNFLDLGLFCGAQVEEEEEKKKGKKGGWGDVLQDHSNYRKENDCFSNKHVRYAVI